MIIYRVINKINGKSYIGQTITSLEKENNGHKHKVINNSDVTFHKSIRRYGWG